MIIATDNADWETIKQDFNSKKTIYEYQEETNKLEDILKKKTGRKRPNQIELTLKK